MIKSDYQIWTKNGWLSVSELSNSNYIMVFNLKKRYCNFKEVKNLKTKILKNNYLIGNHLFSFYLNENNTILDNKYNPVIVKEGIKTILCDSRTIWYIDKYEKVNKKIKFVLFDLEPYEFVKIKDYNSIDFFLSYSKLEKNKEKKILTKGYKNK